MKRFIAAWVVIVIALGIVGNMDVADEYDRGAAEKVLRPQRVMQATKEQILADCPKTNKKKQALRFQIAMKNRNADTWILHCEYGPAILIADSL